MTLSLLLRVTALAWLRWQCGYKKRWIRSHQPVIRKCAKLPSTTASWRSSVRRLRWELRKIWQSFERRQSLASHLLTTSAASLASAVVDSIQPSLM